MKKVYVASKIQHAPTWIVFRNMGYNIISTWIDEAEEGQTIDRENLALRCLSEIKEADFIIFYSLEGEIQKGALIEIGAALSLGKEVRFVGEWTNGSRVFQQHPLWKKFLTIYETIIS